MANCQITPEDSGATLRGTIAYNGKAKCVNIIREDGARSFAVATDVVAGTLVRRERRTVYLNGLAQVLCPSIA